MHGVHLCALHCLGGWCVEAAAGAAVEGIRIHPAEAGLAPAHEGEGWMLREANAVRNWVQAEVAKDGVFRALAPETGLPLPCAALRVLPQHDRRALAHCNRTRQPIVSIPA